MSEDSVKTGVDSLLELLRQEEKIPLIDAAKKLGLSENTIKLWADFLVEEKIVGIEYKFTKPFLYLNKPQREKKGRIIEEQKLDIKTFKEDFRKRAAASNIPEMQIGFLWKDHFFNQLELEKQFFYQEARKRGLENIDELWTAYTQKVTG